MFNNTQTKKKQITLLYSDKTTNRLSNILLEKISDKSKEISLISWSKKQYDQQTNFSSDNKIIAFGTDFKDRICSDPTVKDIFNKFGVHIRIVGNRCLIYTESISNDEFTELEDTLEKMHLEIPKSENKYFKFLSNKDIAIASGISILPNFLISGGIFLIIKNYLNKNKHQNIVQNIYAMEILLENHLDKFLDE